MSSKTTKKKQSPNSVKVKNIVITELKYDVSDPIYKEHKQMLLDLLPERGDHHIEFEIIGDCRTANAIRRTLLSELPIKCLDISDENFQKINSNEDYLFRKNLVERIRAIPISQNIPDDAKFRINKMNPDTKVISILSGDIEAHDKSLRSKFLFRKNIEILELHKGSFIEIPEITVKTNFGHEDGKNQICASIAFQAIDYRPVGIVDSKGYLKDTWVKTNDLLDLYKSLHGKTKNPIDIKDLRFIIIPHGHDKDMSENIRNKMKFSTVLELKKGQSIELFMSTQVHTNHHYLKVRTIGNIDPKKLMQICMDNIIMRLKNIENALRNENTEIIQITTADNVTHVKVNGESSTIIELIKIRIYNLDKSIALINSKQIHPQNRIHIININHAQPIKIMTDAVKIAISDFEKIKSYFNEV